MILRNDSPTASSSTHKIFLDSLEAVMKTHSHERSARTGTERAATEHNTRAQITKQSRELMEMTSKRAREIVPGRGAPATKTFGLPLRYADLRTRSNSVQADKIRVCSKSW